MNENIYGEKMQRRLFIKPYDRMIKDIVDEIDKGMIVLDPDYQRNYVWKNDKASLLVESILLNIPIPVIYASEDYEGKWIIVDGLQRLYSLKRFFNDEFKLTGLETLSELNGKKFSNLEPFVKNKLERGELRIIVLQNDSDENIQFDIFMRLNRGSVTLNEQEMRNCLYRGTLNSLIKEIANNNEYVKKVFPITKTNRMVTNELILRYLAISENYNKESGSLLNYDGRIKNCLNNFMKEYQNPNKEKLNYFKNKFEQQIKKSYSIFGKYAFRKEDGGNKINASLYECIMIAFENYSSETLLCKKQEILSKTKELISDINFEKSIDKATGNTETLKYRLQTYIKAIKDIVE